MTPNDIAQLCGIAQVQSELAEQLRELEGCGVKRSIPEIVMDEAAAIRQDLSTLLGTDWVWRLERNLRIFGIKLGMSKDEVAKHPLLVLS